MVQQSLRMSHRDVPGHHIGMSQDVQWGCPRTSNRDVLRESVTERHWSFPDGMGGWFQCCTGGNLLPGRVGRVINTEIRSLRGGRYHLIPHTASRQTHTLKTTWESSRFLDFHKRRVSYKCQKIQRFRDLDFRV